MQLSLNRLVIGACCLSLSGRVLAAPVTQAIKLDTFGYRPSDQKIAVFSSNPGSSVEIRNTSDQVLYTIPSSGGSITSKGGDGNPSGDTLWWVDFSGFSSQGAFRLYSSSLAAQSYDFEIKPDVYNATVLAALKTFYYQRCNTPKTSTYAGPWSDASSCHNNDASLSPASGEPNFGSKNLTGGWHDAGDYNKYVWGAVSGVIQPVLMAFEDNPGVFKDGDLNIPESGNGIPDVLDEMKWELDWLLKLQVSGGGVIRRVWDNYTGSNSPPSADTTPRFYYGPDQESGGVFAGSCALASRVYAAAGQTAYAATLKTAALSAWTWLQTQGNSEFKVWAAAEIYRMDSTVTSAKTYVDGYYPSNWSGRFFNVSAFDTQAALAYVQASGATAAVVTAMRQNISDQVNSIFSSNDLYRNGMPEWSYHWGSNGPRGRYGFFLLQAAKLGATGSYSAQQCRDHAQDFLHFFHGQNTLRMTYLSHMSALGGDHSSWQFYHSWFGASGNPFSASNFIGKPATVSEPDYPYYKGTDNHGVNDNKVSSRGPAPGFVTGGPNKSYGGTAQPPLNSTTWNRFYRDWADQSTWTAMTWEITENSIGYQGPYVAMGAYFLSTTTTTPVPTSTPTRTPTPGGLCLLLNGAESPTENGTWSAANAGLSWVTSGPPGAITQGGSALQSGITVAAPWQDSFARLGAFTPTNLGSYVRLTADIHLGPGVAGGAWREVYLYGDSASTGKNYHALSSVHPALVDGANALSFPLDFPASINSGDPVSAIFFVINSQTAGTGTVYVDNIRLETSGCSTPTFTPTPQAASPTRTPTRTFSPTPTRTRTATPQGFTHTRTATPTWTRTASPTRTRTRTATQSATRTSTRSVTASASSTRSRTPTASATRTRTPTWTPGAPGSPTRTPTRTFSATRTRTPTFTATNTPASCAFLLNGAETLGENGVWSAANASLAVTNAAPAGAITQGLRALESTITTASAWQDGFAKLSTFTPAVWSAYARLVANVHVTSGVMGGGWQQLALYGDAAGAGKFYQALSSQMIPIVTGNNQVVFNLDFPAAILAGDSLSSVFLVINCQTPGTGRVYLDNIRLETPSCMSASGSPSGSAQGLERDNGDGSPQVGSFEFLSAAVVPNPVSGSRFELYYELGAPALSLRVRIWTPSGRRAAELVVENPSWGRAGTVILDADLANGNYAFEVEALNSRGEFARRGGRFFVLR